MWFAMRMSHVRLNSELLEWRSGNNREAKRPIRVALLGARTVGVFNFPHYVLCPNIKFLQHVYHIEKQAKPTSVEFP